MISGTAFASRGNFCAGISLRCRAPARDGVGGVSHIRGGETAHGRRLNEGGTAIERRMHGECVRAPTGSEGPRVEGDVAHFYPPLLLRCFAASEDLHGDPPK